MAVVKQWYQDRRAADVAGAHVTAAVVQHCDAGRQAWQIAITRKRRAQLDDHCLI